MNLSRIDYIGLNGPTGEHYERRECDKCEDADNCEDTSCIHFRGKYDNVAHPEHYASGDIECIDAIEAALTAEEFRGYVKGNVLKYVWRERLKGQDESLAKAVWYLTKLVEKDNG